MSESTPKDYIRWYEDTGIGDIPYVGGKNASLGEMIAQLQAQGVRVPIGFATSAQLFREFMQQNQLQAPISRLLESLLPDLSNLAVIGTEIRRLMMAGEYTGAQQRVIAEAYQQLCQRLGTADVSVAVRSSATAEDLPEASFAGQQESYLNVTGSEDLIKFCRMCFASLFTDRAIIYRQQQGFAHDQVALSVGVQQMVESDCAGVMFSLDTETGFPDAMLINGAWGLGETIVKGSVTPDRYMVYKPHLANHQLQPLIERQLGSKLVRMEYDASAADNTRTLAITKQQQQQFVLTDAEVLQLSRWGLAIEQHYDCPMDMEWAKDRHTGDLYIVQARPETVQSQQTRAVLHSYHLKQQSQVLVTGASVGSAIATGPVCRIASPEDIEQFPEGGMLVTERTDPDWVPVMSKASGIITDTGGPTSHAAIVSRELKVPAIVGAAKATETLQEGQMVTLDCSGGAVGKVHAGALEFAVQDVDLAAIPATQTQMMINAAMPDGVLRWWALPKSGIGLTRIEFIITSSIGVHPMALLQPDQVTDRDLRDEINTLTQDYEQAGDFFVDQLCLGVSKIAASEYVAKAEALCRSDLSPTVGGKDV